MTQNELIHAIGERIRHFADMPASDLRANYPACTKTRRECIQYTLNMGYTLEEVLEAIIVEEFTQSKITIENEE